MWRINRVIHSSDLKNLSKIKEKILYEFKLHIFKISKRLIWPFIYFYKAAWESGFFSMRMALARL